LGVRRRAPSGGFRPIERDILAQVGQLPCDVFLSLGGHHVLYAAAGADAADLVERVSDDMQLTVRSEDRDELRHSLSRSIGRILEDDRLSPVERSRRAYGAISHVMAPIFNINSGVDRSGLDDATRAIDAIVRRLTVGEDVVWSLVSTMNKHLSTHTHAINTAVYSALLAESVGQFDQDQLGDIGRGALLHDIGKNRVPLAVLDKPGPLDEEEWRLMRKHPQVGYDLVVRALGAAPSYAHIIAEHHERADGSGYPTGVQSGRVPLASQLVAIADAYDALTSARSYKPAGSSYNALWTMRFRMRGQFNPQLLQALVEMLGGWKELRRADARSLELGSAV
jgi:putative nucleotidyltransferase with HDIG domain